MACKYPGKYARFSPRSFFEMFLNITSILNYLKHAEYKMTLASNITRRLLLLYLKTFL